MFEVHLHVLEELVHGLGSRSTRHVMNRADLLVLELLLHVADGYHHRYFDAPARRCKNSCLTSGQNSFVKLILSGPAASSPSERIDSSTSS